MSLRRLTALSAHIKSANPKIHPHQKTFSTTTNPHLTMAAHTNGAAHATTNPGPTPPKITLYTNHACPWAHRAHIALAELNLPHDEVIIDLTTPRPQWYLDLNPRGLVPTIAYSVPGLLDDELIAESGVVAQFLADAFPGPFLPASKESPTSALQRARVNFFADAWGSKVGSHLYPLFMAATAGEKAEIAGKVVSAVEKEIEPLLANAAPFFNGSSEFTLAEALTAPFVIRLYDASIDGELAPKSLAEQLDALPNFGKWAKAVRERPSVLGIYDSKKILEGTKARLAKMAAEKK